METNLSNKDFFDKIACKAFQEGKYDFFGITQQGAMAILNHSELSHIRGAIVLMKKNEKWQEWIVEDYHVKQCHEPLHICIKNLKILAGCVGNTEDEDAYFKLKNVDNMPSQEIKIWGAIEIGECASAFYYDAETKISNYISQSSYSSEHTDLFAVIKNLMNMEVMMHECTKTYIGGLESKKTSANEEWTDAYQWQGTF